MLPDDQAHDEQPGPAAFKVRGAGVALVLIAGALGLALMVDSALRSSATYDEVTYLRVAANWWRTGDQDAITRMGSPLTFWKLQQAPVLWGLERLGRGDWIDDPIGHQAKLLPLARLSALWVWAVAFGLTAMWSRRLYGPRAMVLAAWLFALSPNLLAHGPLLTMELPLVAATTAMMLLFWRFLRTSERWAFGSSALVGGLAFSCKFTVVVIPPILALAWWLDRWRAGETSWWPLTRRVGVGSLGYVALLLMANLVVTGFATIEPSASRGAHPHWESRLGPTLAPLVLPLAETPIPQDWVGFLTQMRHQGSGGTSYLFGARRERGWWYYYLVALAVKVPLTFWLLVMGRAGLGRRVSSSGHESVLLVVIGAFLVLTAVASSRNYGIRYLLPLAPLAIVWVSALAEGPRWSRGLAVVGVLGHALAVAAIHPHELSYFNALTGGPKGGRYVLADSNLDWGQGLRHLAQLQREDPAYRDLTLYYFGDTDPRHYGVEGRCYVLNALSDHPGLPELLTAETRYLAVSASLQWGPWGPDGYFRALNRLSPDTMTDDETIAIYRTADMTEEFGGRQSSRRR